MSIWSRAAELAAQTPPERNRYVDFLRAMSILFVISGHWLIATAHFVDGELIVGDMLSVQPWTQGLTWLFQVMPVFFFVGGYSNAVSLESASRKGIGYAGWLAGRLSRLVTPLLALLVIWAGFATLLKFLGVRAQVVQFGSQAALIPIWFLAIYIVVVVCAPVTYRLWRRFGYASFWLFVALAVAVDALFFVADQAWLGWSNYFWVWFAVHHLGFAWREGRVGTLGQRALCAVIGLLVLVLLVRLGPYPIAMAGSPDASLSNTLPPKITLLALALFQFGFLLSIEPIMRRALSRLQLWTATVLINGMIMTVYLWHMTVMIVVIAIAYSLGGWGLTPEPGSVVWWQTRPLWLVGLTAILLPVSLAMGALERVPPPDPSTAPGAARQIVGAMLIGLGVAVLALYGFGGGPIAGLDMAALGAVVAGAAASGVLPRLQHFIGTR